MFASLHRTTFGNKRLLLIIASSGHEEAEIIKNIKFNNTDCFKPFSILFAYKIE